MPRKSTDYSKTLIYKIQHKDKDVLLYVGSTTNFTKRKNKHKEDSFKMNTTIYKTIRENGGWDEFNMTEIKKYPCNDKREVEAEEERCRVELNATLNMRRAFLTKEERSKDQKEYYILNKDKIHDDHEKWKQNNKEHTKEYVKCIIMKIKKKMNEKHKYWIRDNQEHINVTNAIE